jgi:hypothetical protein
MNLVKAVSLITIPEFLVDICEAIIMFTQSLKGICAPVAK